jgi:hypothetical protein
MKTTIKAATILFAVVILLSSFSNFTKGSNDQTLKFEFTVEEVNVIFDGLGELPAKKSEGLRVKIYQTAQEQLKAQQSAQQQTQSVPKKN